MKPLTQLILSILLLSLTMLIGLVLYVNPTLEFYLVVLPLRIAQYTLALSAGILVGSSISKLTKI